MDRTLCIEISLTSVPSAALRTSNDGSAVAMWQRGIVVKRTALLTAVIEKVVVRLVSVRGRNKFEPDRVNIVGRT